MSDVLTALTSPDGQSARPTVSPEDQVAAKAPASSPAPAQKQRTFARRAQASDGVAGSASTSTGAVEGSFAVRSALPADAADPGDDAAASIAPEAGGGAAATATAALKADGAAANGGAADGADGAEDEFWSKPLMTKKRKNKHKKKHKARAADEADVGASEQQESSPVKAAAPAAAAVGDGDVPMCERASEIPAAAAAAAAAAAVVAEGDLSDTENEDKRKRARTEPSAAPPTPPPPAADEQAAPVQAVAEEEEAAATANEVEAAAEEEERAAPSNSAIEEAVRRVVSGADLTTMTSKTVRKTLETEFGCDLTAQKKSITAMIVKLIQEINEEEGETQTQEQLPQTQEADEFPSTAASDEGEEGGGEDEDEDEEEEEEEEDFVDPGDRDDDDFDMGEEGAPKMKKKAMAKKKKETKQQLKRKQAPASGSDSDHSGASASDASDAEEDLAAAAAAASDSDSDDDAAATSSRRRLKKGGKGTKPKAKKARKSRALPVRGPAPPATNEELAHGGYYTWLQQRGVSNEELGALLNTVKVGASSQTMRDSEAVAAARKHGPSAFLIVGDVRKPKTWRVPFRDDKGRINKPLLLKVRELLRDGLWKKKEPPFAVPELAQKRGKVLCELIWPGTTHDMRIRPLEGIKLHQSVQVLYDIDDKAVWFCGIVVREDKNAGEGWWRVEFDDGTQASHELTERIRDRSWRYAADEEEPAAPQSDDAAAANRPTLLESGAEAADPAAISPTAAAAAAEAAAAEAAEADGVEAPVATVVAAAATSLDDDGAPIVDAVAARKVKNEELLGLTQVDELENALQGMKNERSEEDVQLAKVQKHSGLMGSLKRRKADIAATKAAKVFKAKAAEERPTPTLSAGDDFVQMPTSSAAVPSSKELFSKLMAKKVKPEKKSSSPSQFVPDAVKFMAAKQDMSNEREDTKKKPSSSRRDLRKTLRSVAGKKGAELHAKQVGYKSATDMQKKMQQMEEVQRLEREAKQELAQQRAAEREEEQRKKLEYAAEAREQEIDGDSEDEEEDLVDATAAAELAPEASEPAEPAEPAVDGSVADAMDTSTDAPVETAGGGTLPAPASGSGANVASNAAPVERDPEAAVSAAVEAAPTAALEASESTAAAAVESTTASTVPAASDVADRAPTAADAESASLADSGAAAESTSASTEGGKAAISAKVVRKRGLAAFFGGGDAQEDDDDEEEEEEQQQQQGEQAEPVVKDRAAAYRAQLMAEQESIKRKRATDQGFVDDQAEESDEEQEMQAGLGDFGFGVKHKTDEEKAREEDAKIGDVNEDDLEGVVDELSDDEADGEEDIAALAAKMAHERDQAETKAAMQSMREGYGHATNNTFKGAGARSGLGKKLLAPGGDKRHAQELGLAIDDELDDSDAEGGEKEPEEEVDEEAAMEAALMARHTKKYVTDSESESESEEETEVQEGAPVVVDEWAEEEKREKAFASAEAKRLKMYRVLSVSAALPPRDFLTACGRSTEPRTPQCRPHPMHSQEVGSQSQDSSSLLDAEDSQLLSKLQRSKTRKKQPAGGASDFKGALNFAGVLGGSGGTFCAFLGSPRQILPRCAALARLLAAPHTPPRPLALSAQPPKARLARAASHAPRRGLAAPARRELAALRWHPRTRRLCRRSALSSAKTARAAARGATMRAAPRTRAAARTRSRLGWAPAA